MCAWPPGNCFNPNNWWWMFPRIRCVWGEEEEKQQKWAKRPLSSWTENPSNLLEEARRSQRAGQPKTAACRKCNLEARVWPLRDTKWQQALNQGDFSNTAESAAVALSPAEWSNVSEKMNKANTDLKATLQFVDTRISDLVCKCVFDHITLHVYCVDDISPIWQHL